MQRGSGILLHVTSVPSAYGIGDFGDGAYRFIDFLAEAKQQLWQMLPLNPTNVFCGSSPYSSESAMAINPLLLSPERMISDGFISSAELRPVPKFSKSKVDYAKAQAYKRVLFDKAYRCFKKKKSLNGYDQFCAAQAFWLDDYARFVAFKQHFNGQAWNQWPEVIRDRDLKAIASLEQICAAQIEQTKFLQYLCFSQWFSLKRYCNERGVKVIGDIPIYVSFDSVDVWSRPEIFKLDKAKQPIAVAGVPPDYFSKTGQLWGNPVYRWDVLQSTQFDWWIKRMRHNFSLFDVVRVDHFRGFTAYWEVPFGEPTAVNGRWVNVPVDDFFSTLLKHCSAEAIIAEDLGVITDDVRMVMRKFGFAGMKILLFAFGGDIATNPYIFHNHVPHCVLYTGTHDNNTIKGWYKSEASDKEKEQVSRYLGRPVTVEKINDDLIRMAMMSVADLVIIPLQDVLGLGVEARMNTPSVAHGNWTWRCTDQQLTLSHARSLASLVELYGRVAGQYDKK